MENRIVGIEVRNVSVVPAAAEVLLCVETERVTPTTELRGRLMGPSCRFATTIEVAYPLKAESPGTARVVIPEASLWDPQSPFLYHGPVELWQDGQLCERRNINHGLRSLALTPRGLHVNGRRTVLRGRAIGVLTEAEALALRNAGINLLIVPVTAATRPLWDLADRIGFLVLGRLAAMDPCVAALAAHASCLGWLAEEVADLSLSASHGLHGVAGATVPAGADFALGTDGVMRSATGELGRVE